MWFYAFILLCCLLRSQCAGNTADCFKKEKSLGDLDLAKDAINKAKDLIPNCSEDESSTNGTSCGKKEKALAILEIASELITEAKRNYPTCTDLEPTEFTEAPESTVTPKTTGTTEPPKYESAIDCNEVLRNGQTKSGVYEIRPNSGLFYNKPINVYCDMDTEGGGWTVIQRRGNFSVRQDFYQDWEHYKKGFGDLRGEFWLGNDNIHTISTQGNYAIRFDLEDFEGNRRFANYSSFRIENETALYKLHISGYSGNAGDSMTYNNNTVFCTKDKNNGKIFEKVPCATSRKSGWWMLGCNRANLNGVRQKGLKDDYMYWKDWKNYEGLASAEIKLRRTD